MKFDEDDGLPSLETLFQRELSRSPNISNELVIRAQKGDDFALNEVVLSGARLVRSIALRYARFNRDELHDYEQEGRVGLLEAIERYDGVHAWVPHAQKHIVWAIGHYHQRRDLLGVRPRYRSRWIDHVDAVDEFATAMSLPDALHEVALRERVSTPALQRAYFILKRGELERLDVPVGIEADQPRHELVPDRQASPEFDSFTYSQTLRDALIAAIDEISVGHKRNRERDRTMVKDYYGLDGHGSMRTFDEVGEMHGVTRQRVEQVVSKYVKILQSPTFREKLSDADDLFRTRLELSDVA